MKTLILLLVSTMLLFSCCKEETPIPTTTPTPKYDTITIEASCVGDYKASFDINYNYLYKQEDFISFVQGNQTEKIVIPINYVLPKTWSRKFVGVNWGDFSVSCKPPFTGTNFNSFSSYVSLTIKCNGLTIGFAEATSDTSGTASINAHIQ
jgi:hypothetical protein